MISSITDFSCWFEEMLLRPMFTLLLLSSRGHSPQVSKPLALCTTCSQPQLVDASQPHSVRMMWWNLKRTFVCWIILTEGDYRDGSREQITSSRCCWQEAEARLGPVSSSPLGFLPLKQFVLLHPKAFPCWAKSMFGNLPVLWQCRQSQSSKRRSPPVRRAMATVGIEQSLASLPAHTGSGRAAQSSLDVLCLTVLLAKIKCGFFPP